MHDASQCSRRVLVTPVQCALHQRKLKQGTHVVQGEAMRAVSGTSRGKATTPQQRAQILPKLEALGG